MLKKVIYLCALISLSSCIERNIYRVNRPVGQNIVESVPEIIVPEPEIVVPRPIVKEKVIIKSQYRRFR